MLFNLLSKTFGFNVYLSYFALLKPAEAVRLSVVESFGVVVVGDFIRFFFRFGGSVVQPVAFRVTYLWSVDVCFANLCF